jgi:hypothetical protein
MRAQTPDPPINQPLNDESAKPMTGIAHGWRDFAALEAIICRD